jgi:transglutaminase-like putative cysteine protease
MRQLLYEITHTTTYDYVGDVSVSHHLLRLRPRLSEKQRCPAHELRIDPKPAVRNTHSDYFGNPTCFISVEQPHQQLVIACRSRVAVSPAFMPEPAETPSWEAVRARAQHDSSGRALEAHEFIYASPLIAIGPGFADYAAPSFIKGRPILDAVTDLTRRIQEDFTFEPGTTTVTTPVSDVFSQRRGVCQDFAQFQIACLRSLGLPARYVSGYLETDPPPGQPKLRGIDASHAWASFLCPGVGWIDVDPTNNCFPSMRHIALAWGRDYGDVAPIRGVLIGSQGQSLRVAVDVQAVGPVDSEAERDDL